MENPSLIKYNVLLAPDLCNRLFSIITVNSSGRTYIFHKGFCTILLSDNEMSVVSLLHSAQQKHTLLVKMK